MEKENLTDTSENRSTGILEFFSKVFSMLFSPLLMPTYGIILAFTISNLLILTLSTKTVIVSFVFLLTCVIPVTLIALLKFLKIIDDPYLNNRKERMIPYILTIVCYVATAVYLLMINAPGWLWMFMFGGGCAALVSLFVNFKWKISAHMAGIGGLIALLCRINADGAGMFELLPLICITIVVAGILGTARIVLGRHTLWQVLAGVVNGFVCVFFLY